MSLVTQIKKFNKDIKQHSPNSLIYSYIDLGLSVIICGSSFDDYIRYRFWEKSFYSRGQFITYLRSKKIIKKYNKQSEIYKVEQKNTFNNLFSEHIHRDWLLISNTNKREFEDFLRKHKTFVSKPPNGGQGRGVEIFDRENIDKEHFFETHNNYIIEELIIQHQDMAELNPSSVNTIRVVTFNNNNEVIIVAASLRTGGNNSCVDNLHSGGVCANIDINTGIVDTKGIDYSYKYHIFHPYSFKQIIGFKIPNWDIVLDTAKKCSMIVPNIKYIGWDIAVTNDGCCVIEGNHDPGHDVIQMIDQIGKYSAIKNC